MGERLRDERSRHGLSQQEAADAAGVRREMWARYEGGAEPGAKALAGMDRVGFDVRFILTGARSELDRDERDLLTYYRRCLAERKKLLLDTARNLAAAWKPEVVAPLKAAEPNPEWPALKQRNKGRVAVQIGTLHGHANVTTSDKVAAAGSRSQPHEPTEGSASPEQQPAPAAPEKQRRRGRRAGGG